MTICLIPFFSYESDNFLLNAMSGTGRTDISMIFKDCSFCTKHFPLTKQILEKELPDVLSTECFNEKDLPFEEEVEDTEIAHLFEHILLQMLYSEKTRALKTKTEYNGNTKWNWKEEQQGTFHIEIDSGYSDGVILKESIKKAVLLTEMIINCHRSVPATA